MLNLDGLSFLLVDDEPELLNLLSDVFSDEGATVFLASSGAEALKLLKKQRIDVLISDVRMQGGDGIWLAEQIKSSITNPPLLFICSGYNDVTSDQANSLGISAIFPKPFHIDKMLGHVSSVLKARPNSTRSLTS